MKFILTFLGDGAYNLNYAYNRLWTIYIVKIGILDKC